MKADDGELEEQLRGVQPAASTQARNKTNEQDHRILRQDRVDVYGFGKAMP